MLALSAILFLGLVVIVTNGLFFLETGARGTLFSIWLIIAVLVVLRLVVWPIIMRPSLRRVAIGLEEAYPQLKSRLISAYDLIHIDAEQLGYSAELVEASVTEAGSHIEGLNPSKPAPLGSIRERFAYLALSLLLLLGLSAAFPHTFYDGLKRTANPFGYIPRPTLTTLKIEPGDAEVTKYSDLTISVTAGGKLPEEISIYRAFKNDIERKFNANRNPENVHEWSFTFEDVKRDFAYRVVGGDFESRTFIITVLDRPRIIGLSLTFDYPNYTGLQTQTLEENDGTVDVPLGTAVTVTVKSSKNLQAGTLVFADSTAKFLDTDGQFATATFTATKQGSYHIEIISEDSLSNDDPIEYPIRIRTDEYPIVDITSPGTDVNLSDNMLLPLYILAEDDYGFSRFNLAYTRSGRSRSEQQTESMPADTHRARIPFELWGKPQVSLSYVWDLSRMNLVPNDVVLYWVEAYDNDRVTGPKMAVSRTYAVRFPSIDEIIEEVTGEREEQVGDVEEVARQEHELQKKLEKLTREIAQESEISYEQREDLREVLERQQELLQQLNQTSDAYQQTTEKVADQQLAAMEIVEKMMEVQRLLEEVATEEMREAMRQLREALESMDPEQLKQAAEQFQMSQEELLQRLDRTLALLKRMQVEQRVEDMKALANKLKEMQDKVSEGLKSGDMSPEEAEQMQDRITEGSDLLERGIEELAKMMSEFPDMPADAAKKLSEELGQNSPSQQSKQSKSSMQSGAMSQCMGQMSGLSETFKKTSEKLSQLQMQMQSMLSEETMAAIRKAVFSLLDLSAKQEELNTALGRAIRDKESSRALAAKGSNIHAGLSRVANDVYEIAEKNFMISPAIGAMLGNSINALEHMLGELEQGRGYNAIPSGESAMANMNIAAEKLLETMEQMASSSSSCSGGGMSFFQQMQNMCNQQGQINMGTVPLSQGQQQPGGLTPDQQAAAARLAAEQEAVKKAMGDLAREAAERSEIAGRMDDIVEEMEEVVKDLRNRNVDDRTLQNQEHILSRMLDVQKSLHRREYEEKRRSTTGEDIIRRGPDQLPEDLGERTNILQQQLIRALNQPYPKEYEAMIKAYFRALREESVVE